MRNFQISGRSTIHSQNGMVATSHPIAVSVGLDILKKGGNAVDAAIAMAFVLPICEPQSTGLYGDVFALIKPSNSNNFIGLNGSGSSVKNLTSENLRLKGYNKIPETGVEAITLPGAIASFESLNQKFGSMELRELCYPAIKYAEEGVVVSPRVSFDWFHSFKNLKGNALKFYSNDGKPFNVGSLFKSVGQAEILKKVAREGSKGFYEGEVAEDFIKSLSNIGGLHTYEDFSNVKVQYVEPVIGNFGDINLIEMPPNGQGITAILIKKILDQLNISQYNPFSSTRVHLEAEATKLAYHARDQYIGDPDFNKYQFEEFFSDSMVSNYTKLIKFDSVLPDLSLNNDFKHRDTVYLTVVDKNRCMVSLIFSIFNSFGSGYASEKYGILFHNRGAGFSLQKDHPNELKPGKRPLHTIIPAFLVKKNDYIMPFGVMGGQYQANGHARLISNIVDFGMDLQEAIDTPRSFPEMGYLKLEVGYSEVIARELELKGHKIIRPEQPIGGAQAILHSIADDTLVGGSDPRKDGCALGY